MGQGGGKRIGVVVGVGAERRGWGGGKLVGVEIRVVKLFKLDLSKKWTAIFLS